MTRFSPESHTVGYCTNVHAGTDLTSIRENLERYAVEVRNLLKQSGKIADDAPLPVGLWIPNEASLQLVQGNVTDQFASFLADNKLSAFTINGFPYDHFHQDVVKHSVYMPSWCERSRLEYTKRLAEILAGLIPESAESASLGSISTLPIGWPNNPCANSDEEKNTDLTLAGKHFRELAEYLAKLESQTGRRIVVAIEPEPGCVLDSTDDVIKFFDTELPEVNHREYITVCHDVCHSSVMMEKQDQVLARFKQQDVAVGKVQVSNAIAVDWESMSDGRRVEAMRQLSEFAEDRYLHQTGIMNSTGQFSLATDLPSLIQDNVAIQDRRWVVHFHVPIFLERFEHLSTTQQDVSTCLRTLIANQTSSDAAVPDFTGHFEIETYAWTVLPGAMRKRGLAEDIATEFEWLHRAIEMCELNQA